jgi:glycosyltransferase involved in cell wall biosynthesis
VTVFFIPSWYPSDEDPVAGIFQRDQAEAIAALRPDWRVAVSLSPQAAVWLTRPSSWPNLRQLTDRRPRRDALRENLVEYRRPSVVWTELVHHGNRAGVLEAHRANLRAAAAELGAVDVIHAHVGYPAGWMAMKLSGETGIPFVVTEHMSPFPFDDLRNREGRLKDVLEEPLRAADATIAVSPALAVEITGHGIPQPVYVPNLVDETFFVRGARRESERLVFFTLGAMRPQKGIDLLLRAVARLHERQPEHGSQCTFRIAGTGEDLDEYRALARELGVEAAVEWLGSLGRAELLREYQGCDCFVLASRHESFGIVYAEAIACGKPVIATRSGGAEAIVTPENGLLVDVGEIEGLAEALGEMIERARSYDPEVIRQQFVERFSRPAVVDRLDDVYGSVRRS